MSKNHIRTRVKALKSLMSDDDRLKAAQNIFYRLERLAAFAMADTILMYHALPDELPTREVLAKWSSRKKLYLPRVNGIDLEILPYSSTRTHMGAFHIEEPDGDDVTPVEAMDMIVVPAVAYDPRGNRLGRGRGYYDRLLRNHQGLKIGVCFDCQLVDDIPTEAHDIAVDVIITESHTYTPRHHRN